MDYTIIRLCLFSSVPPARHEAPRNCHGTRGVSTPRRHRGAPDARLQMRRWEFVMCEVTGDEDDDDVRDGTSSDGPRRVRW